jgi:ribose transport system ATP-binding protein
MTHDTIIQKMVGREIKMVRKTNVEAIKTQLFTVNNLSLRHPSQKNDSLLKNISFGINKKEVVGIFGLMGAGRTELMETIFGLHGKRAAGKITIEGNEINVRSPKDAIKAGIALVPEDRKKDGLVPGLDVRTNISLTTLERLQSQGLLNAEKEKTLARKYISDLRIKTSSDRQYVKYLSGGNQQKIVLAKWLATHPKLLMLDEPTRGIDIHAKNEIYKLILQLADEGLGIIVVSSELPEILTLSDRILVMAEGSITAEFVGKEATEDNILKAAIPKSI